MNLEEFARRGMAAQAAVDKLTQPNPTPNPTAEKKIVELTQALKVIDEMRRQNLARIDDATRKAFEEAAENAAAILARRYEDRALSEHIAWCRARGLAKEQGG